LKVDVSHVTSCFGLMVRELALTMILAVKLFRSTSRPTTALATSPTLLTRATSTVLLPTVLRRACSCSPRVSDTFIPLATRIRVNSSARRDCSWRQTLTRYSGASGTVKLAKQEAKPAAAKKTETKKEEKEKKPAATKTKTATKAKAAPKAKATTTVSSALLPGRFNC
jgi:hypothetical protein